MRWAISLVSIMIVSANALAQVDSAASLTPQGHSAYDAVVANAKPVATPMVAGKSALAAKQFLQAKRIFAAEVKLHPDSVEAELGLADAELGLHEYEAAELEYRKVVAAQPEMWQAHKNLVIVEAALGRWEEFDRERAVLRGARERGAPGISARESDVIDSFVVPAGHGRPAQRWNVREYFEPVGRSLTRYNFEHFSAAGKAEEYVSLESEEAAKAVVVGGAVAIGGEAKPAPVEIGFALNWYTGKGHGTIAEYGAVEPGYEDVRARVLRWLRTQ